jgi:two-component system, OmpR family, phosphate regulon sensor histidine kinase PhoR
MQINKLNIAILLGLIVITGILVLQFFLLKQAVQYEEKKFDQKAHVALLEVASKLNGDSKTALPQSNPVDEVADDYYVVNVNNKFDSSSLDFYLKNEFEKFDLITDFEYGIYDCHSEKMQYGNYVSVNDEKNINKINFVPANNYFVYYFAVHFPQRSKYIYKSLKIWIIFSFVMLVVLVLYCYSAFTILQQKKYSELQKDFINNMTHEFKTPISSILISAGFLAKQETIQNDDKIKKYMELIIQQASKLNSHVEKVLNLAKTENNSLSINKTTVDIVHIIHSVAENILFKYPDIKIRMDMPAECFIKADEFHFSNLVYNLLDNSIKYSDNLPEIIITIKKENKNIRLSFADNGIGIPAKHLSNIFEKFYRIPNQKSNEVNGFGLGLFYVNRICKEHTWALSAQSKENNGTEIIILIPANE